MVSRGGAAGLLALLVLGCVVSGVVCSLQDGTPRPANYPDAPTATYDSTPALVDTSGVPVACLWYAWANTLYPATTGTSCLDVLRKALTNATVNPPATLQPYKYYTLKRLIDPANNQSYCYQGCFNLGASAAPASPPLGNPGSPPAMTPNSNPPLPTSFTPAGSPPASGPVASTPAMQPTASTPAMEPSASPPASALSPPAPAVASPPGPTTFNRNGGTFVAPSWAMLSCFVAVVVLQILNLVAH